MFEMKETKIIQIILLILSFISIVILYVQSNKTYISPSIELDKARLIQYSSQIILFLSIAMNIVIYCIRKDIEANLESLKKRFLDERKNN